MNVKSLNSVTIVGCLGSDPRLVSENFGGLATFSVATTTKYLAKDEEKPVEKTTWVPCSVTGKMATNAAKYLKKGDLLCVTGSINVRDTEQDDGTTRQYVDVRANDIQLLCRSSSTAATSQSETVESSIASTRKTTTKATKPYVKKSYVGKTPNI